MFKRKNPPQTVYPEMQLTMRDLDGKIDPRRVVTFYTTNQGYRTLKRLRERCEWEQNVPQWCYVKVNEHYHPKDEAIKAARLHFDDIDDKPRSVIIVGSGAHDPERDAAALGYFLLNAPSHPVNFVHVWFNSGFCTDHRYTPLRGTVHPLTY